MQTSIRLSPFVISLYRRDKFDVGDDSSPSLFDDRNSPRNCLGIISNLEMFLQIAFSIIFLEKDFNDFEIGILFEIG